MVMTNVNGMNMARRNSISNKNEESAELLDKHDEDEDTDDYQASDDYKNFTSNEMIQISDSRISRRTGKSKKQESTIAPKLQNLFLRNSPLSLS
jgi:hypothetical protein